MSLEARLEWRSPMAGHVDRLVINRSALQADGRWLAAGEALNRSAEVCLNPTPWCQPAGLPPIEIDLGAFRPRVELVAGRFYPRLAFGRLLGSARDTRPVRLIACDPQTKLWRIDPNHPLAADSVRMFLRQTDDAAAPGIRLAELFDGPGMQRLPDDPAATYFPTGALQREDNAADTDFYARPRLTQHLDAHCRAGIANLYGRLLQPGMRVLDLMSSIASHLPETPADLQVSGLGMNPDELSANPRLAERVVHDLNACATLPWRDDNPDKDGRVAGRYRKIHLFSPSGENRYFAGGDARVVCETGAGRLGLMICYDGFFPEVARELSNRGAEVIAWPVWGCWACPG